MDVQQDDSVAALFADRSPAELALQTTEWIHKSETWVNVEGINLHAGNNIQSPAVRRAMCTTLNGRPSLGDPGDKYGTGVEFSDRVEIVAQEGLKRLFNAQYAEHRVLSGTMANLYAYMAIMEPGDTLFAMPAECAGHASHHAEGAAGLYRLRIENIPCHTGTHSIDWERFAMAVGSSSPKAILVGSSLPLLPYDLPRVREIADSVGARVIYDCAHVAGIIAGGRFQDPLSEGADVVTMSTYKSFSGPSGGAVVTNDPLLHQNIRSVAFPGLTANNDMSRVCGLAIACLELLEFGPAFVDQCLRNAQALSRELASMGLEPWSPDGGHRWTASHIVALDASRWGGGNTACQTAELSNLFFTPIPLAGIGTTGSPVGIRLGVQEVTRWGMQEADMAAIARFLHQSLEARDKTRDIAAEVKYFREGFQTIRFCFS